jgi:ectoine hydroxylase-related dioxygenase (phytanoyl-CoA dioxygenase family)
LEDIFRGIFKGDPCIYDLKWVRVMSKGENTEQHTDYYRFAHHARSERMYTCWIPLGDYKVEDGMIAICKGSHLLIDPKDEDEDGNLEGKVELPEGFRQGFMDQEWFSADFNAGDICIFDIRAVHASVENQSLRYRVSMDTRWKAASKDGNNHHAFKTLTR